MNEKIKHAIAKEHILFLAFTLIGVIAYSILIIVISQKENNYSSLISQIKKADSLSTSLEKNYQIKEQNRKWYKYLLNKPIELSAIAKNEDSAWYFIEQIIAGDSIILKSKSIDQALHAFKADPKMTDEFRRFYINSSKDLFSKEQADSLKILIKELKLKHHTTLESTTKMKYWKENFFKYFFIALAVIYSVRLFIKSFLWSIKTLQKKQ